MTQPSRTTLSRSRGTRGPSTVYGEVAHHLTSTRSEQQRRWVRPSVTREPGLEISVLASHDEGTHASGWWRNSDYDRCWHLSLCAMTRTSFEVLPDADLRAWSRGVFGLHLSKAWIEPPASKLDLHRNAAASPYTTHIRVFLDRAGRPIQPTGEVYTLKPWVEGDSPAKVFRS